MDFKAVLIQNQTKMIYDKPNMVVSKNIIDDVILASLNSDGEYGINFDELTDGGEL